MRISKNLTTFISQKIAEKSVKFKSDISFFSVFIVRNTMSLRNIFIYEI